MPIHCVHARLAHHLAPKTYSWWKAWPSGRSECESAPRLRGPIRLVAAASVLRRRYLLDRASRVATRVLHCVTETLDRRADFGAGGVGVTAVAAVLLLSGFWYEAQRITPHSCPAQRTVRLTSGLHRLTEVRIPGPRGLEGASEFLRAPCGLITEAL